jgi:dephospho-CoA kinase
MLLVALTGGIATGKSIVAEILEQLGCYIHEADHIAHQLMEPERPAWKFLVSHYGTKILNQDKTIDRTALGAIVFSNEKERLFLNALLHPLVMEKKKQIIKKLRDEGTHKIFISVAALTIEAGFRDFYDKIVVVYCNK